MTSDIIGADALIVWDDNDPEDAEYWYISFGYYDDDTGRDSFGVPDYCIAHYAEGEEELKQMLRKDSGYDFHVLSYELITRSEP